MMLMPVLPLLFSLVFALISALEVSSNSPCASVCDGPSNTFPANLTCIDNNYSATDAGTIFRACLQCEASSTAVDGTINAPQNNDVYWFLFNMKYSLEYCLFQSGNSSTPNLPSCSSVCAPLYPVLTTSWFATPRPGTYEYCTQNGSAFKQSGYDCASCLREDSGSVILGNYIRTMLNACDKKPQASKGQTINVGRGVFNSATIAQGPATTASAVPSTTSAYRPSAATTTSAPAANATAAAAASSASSSGGSGLSTGAAAGIGVACGVLALAALGVLVWFVMRRRKNKRKNAGVGGERKPLNQQNSPYQESIQGQHGVYGNDLKKENAHRMEPVEMWGQQRSTSEVHGQDSQRFEMVGDDGRRGQMSPGELDGRAVG